MSGFVDIDLNGMKCTAEYNLYPAEPGVGINSEELELVNIQDDDDTDWPLEWFSEAGLKVIEDAVREGLGMEKLEAAVCKAEGINLKADLGYALTPVFQQRGGIGG